MKVGVVGIGRVGLPFAAVSSRHFKTIGVDVDKELVRSIEEGARSTEPGLNDYLRSYQLKASTDFSLLSDRDIVFFFVGSQSPGLGYSSKKLLAAMEMASPHLGKGQVVTISTTIPPGELKSSLIPKLESIGLLSNVKGLAYSPSMIALGSVIKDFEKPNYILVGESNMAVGDALEQFWRIIVGNDVPVFRSTIANIALAKYALNMALVMKISLMSLVTELSEKEEGDVDFLSEIFKMEPRIAGPRMFRGGLGYGGTCFPVDVEAIRYECKRLAVPTEFADAVTHLNNWQVTRSVSLVKSLGKKKIALLGVTYKPDTSITIASQALEIGRRLALEEMDVVIYDPEGEEAARKELGTAVHYARSAKSAITSADLVFIAVDWQEFATLEASDFREDQVVVDPWRILRGKKLKCKYYGFGLGDRR